ncbi:hypothetical protein J437_LFUL000908 [Ladona fulva]|uniref:Ig-like domain-containing protein n=1 Tax=Ladona fulva TaxID=123851 RepID=A0A8K0P1B8_LADFU|nr:hypothetical protein J437_LFUL000908 [Ladona fulva]
MRGDTIANVEYLQRELLTQDSWVSELILFTNSFNKEFVRSTKNANSFSIADFGVLIGLARQSSQVQDTQLRPFHQLHPVIQVPNQLVGAPLATDVTLECYVEASPKSINYWVRESGEYCFAQRPRLILPRMHQA